MIPGENTESLTLSLECHFSNYVLQLLVRPRHFYNYRGGILAARPVSSNELLTGRFWKLTKYNTKIHIVSTGVIRRTYCKHEFPEFQGKFPARVNKKN